MLKYQLRLESDKTKQFEFDSLDECFKQVATLLQGDENITVFAIDHDIRIGYFNVSAVGNIILPQNNMEMTDFNCAVLNAMRAQN